MSSLFSVKDKVIVITGASSGLGCHFAKTLAREGARVVMCARRLDKLRVIAEEITKEGGIAMTLELDVKNGASVKKLAPAVVSQFGQIDVLINNAGVDARKNLFETTEMDWAPVVDTNLKGVVFVTQAIAAQMVEKKKGGSIINISSVSDLLAFKGGNPAYMISKAGISHFTHLLALELASSNIRVNAIAPGVFRTEINADLFDTDISRMLQPKIPLLKFGQLDDLNGALLLLSSDASRYMTGTIIRVDGGLGINKL